MTFVLFATPSLDHSVTLEFFRSALKTHDLCQAHGIKPGWAQRAGDCFIAKARNKLCAEFLASDATDLFFLDDDIGWPAEKVIEFIARPELIVAGVYPKKQDDLDWPCALAANAETGELIERDGLVRAEFVPAGFLRIKRELVQLLYDKAAPFREPELNGEMGHYRAPFLSGPAQDGRWWGEDYAFCNAVNAEGVEIWIDPNIEFTHRGRKRWGGTMGDHMDIFRAKAKQAVEQAA